MSSCDVAIIGFGFGGLMTLAQTVRQATQPLTIEVWAENVKGAGLAYGTDNLLHLLNVPAKNMGAWAQSPDDFAIWLATVAGEAACAELGVKLPTPEDFAPRMLYAQYLASIRDAVLKEAQQKQITIRFHYGRAQRVTRQGEEWIITANGAEGTAKKLVLATGNEPKHLFTDIHHPAMIQNPWKLSAEQIQSWGKQPVVMVGTGLTAVDMVLTLRRMGYRGPIHAISRNGLLPLPHQSYALPYLLDAEALLALPTLLEQFRFVREAIRQHQRAGGDWRAVIDALRPYAIRLWQRLSPREQQSFVRRLATMWNSHRHRMAPDIAAILKQEITSGHLTLGASFHLRPAVEGEQLKLAVQWTHGGQEILQPVAIINCSGFELNWQRSSQELLQQLLQQNLVEAHPTYMGVRADKHYRVAPTLYAIGSAMTGQFWESTAVPELRQQAEIIGAQLCQ
jgi:uncharacterized NAD(P)/FAD-binding protein YdhS